MNRRSFLTRLSTGLVGACVATHLPTAYLPAKVRTTAALDYLRRTYNDFCKGSGVGHYPKMIYAGRALYDAAKSELIEVQRRYQGGYYVNARYPESLMFKAATLRPSEYLAPWAVAIFYEDSSNPIIIREP
jgi:hypothetical protein